MEIILTAKHFELNSEMENYIRQKINKLDKFYHSPVNAEITLKKEGYRYTVELSLHGQRAVFNALETASDLYSGVDQCVAKIQLQMRKYKDKLIKKHHNEKFSAVVKLFSRVKGKREPLIVETKRYDVKPMGLEEAIAQMEALDYHFLPFVNGETGKVNIVYLRSEGNYALIEPEF